MKTRILHRVFAGLLAGALLVSATSCAQGGDSSSTASEPTADTNFNEKGWPVVNDTVTLKVYGSRNSESPEDWNDLILIQQMEETTNVHLEFELVESSTYTDRRAIKLSSTDDLPDVIKDGLTVTEIIRYANDGLIVPLDELQEQYAPNFMNAMNSEYGKEVAMEACSTMLDGRRYTFPSSGRAPFIGLSRIGAINTDWLEAVGMDMPTTLEEFKEVLIAFRDKDPNGNGQKDEIPLSWQGALFNTYGAWDFGLNWLGDSFQCPSPDTLVNVKDGKVYFVGQTEEYKNFIKWLNELYNEGLLDDTGFSQTADQYKAKLNSETPVVGVASVWEIGDDFGTYDAYNYYDYLDPMKGLDGQDATPYVSLSDVNIGMWAVTKECDNPAIAVRVADYLYEDTKRNLEFLEGRMGEEVDPDQQIRQVPCTECNDGVAYMVGDPPEGVNTQSFRVKTCPAGGMPFFARTEDYEKYQHLHYTDKKSAKIAAMKESGNADTEVLPTLTYTQEESDLINQIQSDIITNANRFAAEWVANGQIDEQWDSYLETLKSIGLEDMLNAMQTAYDRYLEASK